MRFVGALAHLGVLLVLGLGMFFLGPAGPFLS